jgi:hypothetical protein
LRNLRRALCKKLRILYEDLGDYIRLG